MAGDAAGHRARQKLSMTARLRKLGERVLLDAAGSARLSAPCGRCLTPVEVDVPLEFSLTFVPARGRDRSSEDGGEEHEGSSESGSFVAEGADEELYTGKVLELDPVVREQLLLALPPYPVCSPDCKGLCPVCGGSRNERPCGCDPHVPDPTVGGAREAEGRSVKAGAWLFGGRGVSGWRALYKGGRAV